MLTDGADLSLAPGCYGAALAFDPEAAECAGCPFAQSCGPASEARLQKLRAEFGIDGIVTEPARRRRKPKKEVEGATLHPELPKKVRELIERIAQKDIKVGEMLRRGVNPFEKPGFLKVACHLLLRLPHGFDRQTLRAALQHKFGWTYGTAQAHVGQVFTLMPALGVCVEMNGKLRLKGN